MSDAVSQPAAHLPVLLSECVEGLNLHPGGIYLDATVGLGGHARALLEAAPGTRLVAVDRDGDALELARQNLAEFGDRVEFYRANFAELPDRLPPEYCFDGAIADLGVSSLQLDRPERGFSFRHAGPLDMRMDREDGPSAAEIINTWEETKLADIFYHYGEERLSRRIARTIVQRRPFQTTTALAEAIAHCVPRSYRYGRIHPATRSFQGLRVYLNRELESLDALLAWLPQRLKEGARCGIVSFHSLEDRAVKHGFRNAPTLRVLTKKPIVPGDAERQANPRSRSAKLRFAERVPEESGRS